MRLDKLSLQFALHDTGLISDVLEAYERLILDAMRGDHTLFTTAEGIERLWEVSMPLLEAPPQADWQFTTANVTEEALGRHAGAFPVRCMALPFRLTSTPPSTMVST
jgi:glucose-6-phosphate 1-dehydrogenase